MEFIGEIRTRIGRNITSLLYLNRSSMFFQIIHCVKQNSTFRGTVLSHVYYHRYHIEFKRHPRPAAEKCGERIDRKKEFFIV